MTDLRDKIERAIRHGRAHNYQIETTANAIMELPEIEKAQARIAELQSRVSVLGEALKSIKSHKGDDAYHTAIATKALDEAMGAVDAD
jgi:uncharacterized protein YlxW (UPF0749 family)